MKIQMQSSPAFNGKLTLTTYSKKGVAKVEEYATTKTQDILVKRVASTMAEQPNMACLENTTASELMTLISGLIGKKLKQIDQPKLLRHGVDRLCFGDVAPSEGGFFVKLIYNNRLKNYQQPPIVDYKSMDKVPEKYFG